MQPLRVGQPHPVERDVRDVQDRVEHLAAPDGDFVGVDDEDAAVGDHGEPLGPVGIEHVLCGAVEHPALCVAVGRHAVIDRRTRLLRVEAVAHQRRELRQRRQERRRVGGAAQLLEHDRQLDGVLRIGQLRPARVDIGLPQRRGIDAVLGDLADQRRWTLLADGIADGVLPQPLIRIELE